MKERPILFSAPMVRALMAGTKTQTRRIIKPQPSVSPELECEVSEAWENGFVDVKCPYGQLGDRLWVRESWRYCCAQMSPHCVATIEYKADGAKRNIAVKPEQLPQPRPENGEGWDERMRYLEKWWAMGRPSIHMPRWASRITLEVTGVHVERLQDISRGDAMAEGCPFPNMAAGPDPRRWFEDLWTEINKPGSWNANPWVWRLDFKQVAA